jgi:hypothetical protein
MQVAALLEVLFQFAVSVEDLPGSRDRILDPRSRRLRFRPKLEVLEAVVVSDAVLVMHVLPRQEEPLQVRLHHEDVFEDVVSAPRSGVARRLDHHVSTVMGRSTALPCGVRRS